MSAVDWSPGLGSLSPAHHISMLGKTILASVTVSCCWLLLSRSQPLLIPCCPCVARLIDTRCYSVSSSIVGTTVTGWSQSCVGVSLTPRCRCTMKVSFVKLLLVWEWPPKCVVRAACKCRQVGPSWQSCAPIVKRATYGALVPRRRRQT